MIGEYRELIALFGFIMGLVTFGGFVLTMERLARATPKALAEMAEILGAHATEEADALEEIITTVDKIKKVINDLKYQHDNPDNFNFGTEKTNELLTEVKEKLVHIQAKLNAMG